MVVKVVNGKKIDYPDVKDMFTFTDTEGNGVTITQYGPFFPDLWVDLGFDNEKESIHWVYRNWGKIRDNLQFGQDTIWYQYCGLNNAEHFDEYRDGGYLAPNGSGHPVRVKSTGHEPVLVGKTSDPLNIISVGTEGLVLSHHGEATDMFSSPSRRKWGKLKNYSHRMDPDEHQFFRTDHGEHSVYFGLELEFSSKVSPEELSYICTDVEPKQEPFFIFKQDSSIGGKYRHMLELVTVPATPRYLRKNFKIFFAKLEKLTEGRMGDYFDTDNDLSNGIHIHVSRASFQGKLHCKKFTMAMLDNRETWKRILSAVAKRPSGCTGTYCKWTEYSRYRGNNRVKTALRTVATEKYSIVNTTPSQTVEVRCFQGIFDIKHITQCISFTEAMFEYTYQIGLQELGAGVAKGFKSFTNTTKKYAALKGLY